MPEKEAPTPTENKVSSSPPNSGSSNKIIILMVAIISAIAIVGVISFFVFGLVGKKTAETITEKAAEQATGGKVDISDDGKKVTIETDEGKATIGTNKVPDSFPFDITIYTGSEVTSTTETNNGVSIILKTSDSVSTSFDFYKSDLKNNGWAESSSSTYQGSSILLSTKGNKQVVVTATTDPSDDKTLISISVSTATE